ncbi:MAG: T9SS type A sorting domain-containing protein, partial [bacterium]
TGMYKATIDITDNTTLNFAAFGDGIELNKENAGSYITVDAVYTASTGNYYNNLTQNGDPFSGVTYSGTWETYVAADEGTSDEPEVLTTIYINFNGLATVTDKYVGVALNGGSISITSDITEMTLVPGTTDVYAVTYEAGIEKAQFVVKPTESDWQWTYCTYASMATIDEGCNCYTFTSVSGSVGSGSWGTYTPPVVEPDAGDDDGDTEPASYTFYLNTGGADLWGGLGVRFAIFELTNYGSLGDMTLVENETYVYTLTVNTSDIENGIYFVCYDNDENMYFTGDLTSIDGNCYTITAKNTGNLMNPADGTWSTYVPGATTTDPEDDDDTTGDDVVTGYTFYLNTGGEDLWGMEDRMYSIGYKVYNSITTAYLALSHVEGEENLYSVTVPEEFDNIFMLNFAIQSTGATTPSYNGEDYYTEFYYNPSEETKTYHFNGNMFTITSVNGSYGYGVWSTYSPSTGEGGTTVDVDVNTVNAFDVIGNNGRLYINGEGDAQLMVYSITGQVVVNTSFNSNFNCQLQKGIYIIQLNGVAQKVSLY